MRRKRKSTTYGTYGNAQGSLGPSATKQAGQAQQQTQTGNYPGNPATGNYTDWQSILAQSQANRNVGLANQQYAYDTGAINRDFGYLPNGQINPNDPYARASLLEAQYKQDQRQATGNYAARGSLYSGALQSTQNELTRQHSIAVNQLQNQYQDAQANARFQQLGAYANAGNAISDSDFQALLRLLGK